MVEQILLYIFMTVLALGLLSAFVLVVGASLYDTLHIRRNKRTAQPTGRSKLQASVCILVITENNANTIEACLKSIIDNSYKSYEICVIDNLSSDDTKKIVDKLIRAHLDTQIRLIAKRKKSSIAELRRTVKLAKNISGELVLVLSGNSILDRKAIQEAVNHFNSSPSVGSLVFNARVLPSLSLSGLTLRLDSLAQSYINKLKDIFGSGLSTENDIVAMYSRSAYQKLKKPRSPRGQGDIAYGSPAIAYTGTDGSTKTMIEYIRLRITQKIVQLSLSSFSSIKGTLQAIVTVFSLIASLLGPFVVVYFLYVSYAYDDSTLLLITFLALLTWFGILILTAEHMRPPEKIQLAICTPAICCLFLIRYFVYTVVAVVELLKTLSRHMRRGVVAETILRSKS